MKNELETILREHEGKDNAITSGELSEKLGGVDYLDSTPKTRKLITELLEDGLPVAASHQGYYIPRDDNEKEEYIDKLRSRRNGIDERIEHFKEAAQ